MCRLKEAASASQEPPSRLINRELQSSFPAHMLGNFLQEDTARGRIQYQPNRTQHTTECSPFHRETLIKKKKFQIFVRILDRFRRN